MRFSALASGSSGNCFYIEDRDNAILIDAGISFKQVKERAGLIGADMKKIKGIFITHEHTDHVKGADVLARELGIPIFATKGTIKNSFLCSDEELINDIKSDETVRIGSMEIEAFSKSHRAEDPVSYNIFGNKKVSVITDAGTACSSMIDSVHGSNLLCLESNHDLGMLENGPYPAFLKKWIKSDTGHLSNKQAGLLVLEHASTKLNSIVLAHLSQNNNNPLMALSTFNSLIRERKNFSPKVLISTRFGATQLIKI